MTGPEKVFAQSLVTFFTGRIRSKALTFNLINTAFRIKIAGSVGETDRGGHVSHGRGPLAGKEQNMGVELTVY